MIKQKEKKIPFVDDDDNSCDENEDKGEDEDENEYKEIRPRCPANI